MGLSYARNYSARIGVFRDEGSSSPDLYLLKDGWPGYESIPVFDYAYISLAINPLILDAGRLNNIIFESLTTLPGNNFMSSSVSYDIGGISKIDIKFAANKPGEPETPTNMNQMLLECEKTLNPFTGNRSRAFFFTITFYGKNLSSSIRNKAVETFDFPYILSRDNLTVASVRIEDDTTLSYTGKRLVEGDERLSAVTPGTLTEMSNETGEYKLSVTLEHLPTGVMNVSWNQTYCPYIESIVATTSHLIITTTETVPSVSIVNNVNNAGISAPGDLLFLLSYPSDRVVLMTPNTISPNLFAIVSKGTKLVVTFCIFTLVSF